MDFFKMKSYFDKKYSVLSKFLPEIIAVKFGLKISTMITLNKNKFDKYVHLIHDFCSKTDLNFNHYHYFGKKESKILISNKKISIVHDLENQNKNNRFSYPKCCQKNYVNLSNTLVSSCTINSLKQLQINKKGNNFFDFEMNPFLKRSPFHLYLHVPCSLKCKKTLSYNKKLLKLIKNNNKILYSAIVNFNKVPVFYLDIYGIAILFDGYMKSDNKSSSIFYRKFYYSIELKENINESSYNLNEDILLFEKIIQAFHQGNQIIFQNNKLIIRNETNLIDLFKKPNHLYWKMIDFC